MNKLNEMIKWKEKKLKHSSIEHIVKQRNVFKMISILMMTYNLTNIYFYLILY